MGVTIFTHMTPEVVLMILLSTTSAGFVFSGLYHYFIKGPTENAMVKQGAYGKVKIHANEPSLVSLLFSPSKIYYLYKFYTLRKDFSTAKSSDELPKGSLIFGLEGVLDKKLKADAIFCEDKLDKVSRSFALVIKFLPSEQHSMLRLGVALFYLVLRALDTVEDEMDLEKFRPLLPVSEQSCEIEDIRKFKISLLLGFYKRLLPDENAAQPVVHGVGDGDELEFLDNFDRAVSLIQILPRKLQDVIVDITKQMGEGMSQYIGRDLRNGTENEADFFNYCHFVAGLVGAGLTRLFEATNTINVSTDLTTTPKRMHDIPLYESMGQFLQRTNIIRDYLEDFVDGRAFWPKDTWTKYIDHAHGDAPSLGAFASHNYIESGRSVECLNEMIANALGFLPDVFKYLDAISDDHVYAFCAVPQVMAIRTLEECFDNHKVFTGVVKMSKVDSAEILVRCWPSGGTDIRADTRLLLRESISRLVYKSEMTRVYPLIKDIYEMLPK